MRTPNETNPPADAESLKSADAPDPLSSPDPLEAQLSTRAFPGACDDRIVVADWARHFPPIMARIPQVRLGTRWFSTL